MTALNLRKELLFETSPADFSQKCSDIRHAAEMHFRSGDDVAATAIAVRELSIDLQSYLVN